MPTPTRAISQRSIPARAGKPWSGRNASWRPRVYPRAGGETTAHRLMRAARKGLSPRGRGNPGPPLSLGSGLGSIPARAGKPRPSAPGPATQKVYPRAGGETYEASPAAAIEHGLSPRGRGNLAADRRRDHGGGSIPARAGKPRDDGAALDLQRVYPRAGGETMCSAVSLMRSRGLSPRGRGNRQGNRIIGISERSIPARAGKPHLRRPARALAGVYPRAGGETLDGPNRPLVGDGLSPRGRGNPVSVTISSDPTGSIPARAGKPPWPWSGICRLAVYPRAGGETSTLKYLKRIWEGLSPRGRGNLCVILTHSYAYVKDRWIALLLGRYGRSPAMCRIRFHTSLASGSAR